MDGSSFEILPAIDLREGRVVRLRQGDFARETAYDTDPIAVARSFADAGATWLHIVDLDAARTGVSGEGSTVEGIVATVGERVAVEVAGGLRTERAVAAALRGGAARTVVGTAALDNPGFASRLVDRHGPDRIAVALDVRHGMAVGHGWSDDAPSERVEDSLARLADAGIEIFEVTSIPRDGLLGGPDLELLSRVIGRGRGAIIASGGISSIEDLLAVRDLGCSGAIVGRALYEGRIDLGDAIAAVS
jgi:phosphoribosylformimino-5-aminoimidazole carboxamide ribotide isomerase